MMGLLSKVQGRKAPNIVRQEVHSAVMKVTVGIEGNAMRTRISSSKSPTGKRIVFQNTKAAFAVKTVPIR